MNFTNIRGRQCRIMWSHRDPTLRKTGKGNIFVKNLAPTIDNKTLYDTFSMFGNILSCKVSMNQQGESLGYGFVHYESEEAANNAIANVNGMVIAEQKVVVEPFRPRSERGSNNRTFTNLFVKNVPEEKTQEELEALFAAHGTITSAVLVMDRDDPSKHRGFGFVNFETPEQAVAAIEAFKATSELEVVKARYAWNRELLMKRLPELGLPLAAPMDGAFYAFCDVTRHTNDSMEFARRMLAEAHVAATPGRDFDPLAGHRSMRFSYAGSHEDMVEARNTLTLLQQASKFKSYATLGRSVPSDKIAGQRRFVLGTTQYQRSVL